MKKIFEKIMLGLLFTVLFFFAIVSQKCQAIADNHLRSEYTKMMEKE